jgi:outer membrane protein with beta-barrel domain
MLRTGIRAVAVIVFPLSLILVGWRPAFTQDVDAGPGHGLERAGLAGGGLLRSSDLYASSPAVADAAPPAAGTPSSLPQVSAVFGPTPFPSAAINLGAEEEGSHRAYLEAKVGPIWFVNDFDDLDVGLDFEGALGAHILPFLSVEARSGYIGGDDSDSDLWAIPLLGNLRLQIPLLLFKPYAGIGGGGFYIHTHETRGAISASENDYAFGWNIFAGLNLTLGPVILGAEIKYLGTESVDTARGPAKLEGVSLLANLGFRF